MAEHHNYLNQPIGPPLDGWHGRDLPPRSSMEGQYCKLVSLNPDLHAVQLYEAFAEDKDNRSWTYLPYGPFNSIEDYTAWMNSECMGDDPMFFAIIDPMTSSAAGVASYMRIKPDVGVIEVGHIDYSPKLQKTRAATEAMYLMMRRAFDELGYRRYEWKCDALNEGSIRAARRLGFTFEGIFRQATMYKGRSRDTAWYSIIDREWPNIKSGLELWLDSKNFDSSGMQQRSLSDCMPA